MTSSVDRAHVSVIGYGESVGPAFRGKLASTKLVSLSELGHNPLEVEKRKKREVNDVGEIFEEEVLFPVWVEPQASGLTPMKEAFEIAEEIVAERTIVLPFFSSDMSRTAEKG